MGKSKIEWTEKVWNPVTGCTKVSDGCKYCYADRMFPRVYGNTNFSDDGKNIRPRKFTDIKLHHDRIEQPLCWKKPILLFGHVITYGISVFPLVNYAGIILQNWIIQSFLALFYNIWWIAFAIIYYTPFYQRRFYVKA